MGALWLCLLSVWSLAVLLVLRGVLACSTASLWPALNFAPTESVSPRQLGAYLLSANLALLANDDFNQLKSALPKRKVRQLLRGQWQIRSRQDFECVLADRLEWCGVGTAEEMQALSTWHQGHAQTTPAGAALEDICRFLSVHAGIVHPRTIGDFHLNLVAWDVQQLAYMVRLGASLDYLSTSRAHALLTMLHREARMHYTSWGEYSLSSLIGMGLRSPVDLHQASGWHRIAASHAALLRTPTSPMVRLGLWSTAASPAPPAPPTAAPHAQPWHVRPLSSFFDTLR
ncbi:DUF1266 domain-containing protein [Variovorax sp. ZT4R33]|uniref:DUF1266 domain-containing protein n=1 Tax=Variovorax sp. ZT4R33 TaxID=3443743 RepID=UPI003F448A9D